MSKTEKCPLSNEERQKYCLCETCLFAKRCLEDINAQIEEWEQEQKNDEKVRKNGGTTKNIPENEKAGK